MRAIASVIILIMITTPYLGMAQVKESLVDVGGCQLHFTIVPGKGTPILFEAGGGNDGTIWKGIIQTIADITEATVICYDRSGLGKSTIDSTQIGIENEIKGLDTARKNDILERGYAQALIGSSNDRRDMIRYQHSEGDLNEWGYALLQHNEKEKALEVFKLNVFLHPESANAYDSLADCYQSMGNKEASILNYKKAIELNPRKESALKALEKLSK